MFSSAPTIGPDRLAHLALQAATQIDKLQRKGKKAADFQVITRFTDVLSSFSGLDDATGEKYSMLDPTTAKILTFATSKTVQRNIQNSDILRKELASLIGQFRKVDLSNTAQLDTAMRFCLSIYECIARLRSNGPADRRIAYEPAYSG